MAVPGEIKSSTCPVSYFRYKWIPENMGTEEENNLLLSNLLFHSYFLLREFSEPDVFSVLRDPKWISPPQEFVQLLPKPIQTLCSYGFHWQEVSQAYHHNFPGFVLHQAPVNCIYRLLLLLLEEAIAASSFSFCHRDLYIQILSFYSYFMFSGVWSFPACSFSQRYGRFPQICVSMIIFPEHSPKVGDQETQ